MPSIYCSSIQKKSKVVIVALSSCEKPTGVLKSGKLLVYSTFGKVIALRRGGDDEHHG